jgi:hypothetical protein
MAIVTISASIPQPSFERVFTHASRVSICGTRFQATRPNLITKGGLTLWQTLGRQSTQGFPQSHAQPRPDGPFDKAGCFFFVLAARAPIWLSKPYGDQLARSVG